VPKTVVDQDCQIFFVHTPHQNGENIPNDPQNIPNGHRQDLVSAKNGG
jgi:hypothetical protein